MGKKQLNWNTNGHTGRATLTAGAGRHKAARFALLLGALGILLAGAWLVAGMPAARPAAAQAPLPQYLPLIVKGFPPQHTVFGVELSNITTSGGLDAMAETGVYWTRKNGVRWSEVEPIEGERNWDPALETELINAAAKGMPVVLVVRSTPEWAQLVDGFPCGPIKPDEMGAFAVFMYDLVTRYSQAPYYVKYYELWNEPDVAPSSVVDPEGPYGCWGDLDDPFFGGGYYADMLQTVYPLIKAADPNAQVLVGGLLLDCDPRLLGTCVGQNGDLPAKFLEGILLHGGTNNGGNFFDGLSIHAFDYYKGGVGQYHNPNWGSAWNTTGPTLIAKINFVEEVLAAYQVTGKFYMNTEGALLCGGPFDPPGGLSCSSDPTSPFELTKAYYTTQLFATAIKEDLRANMWFTALGWLNSGLLYPDLTPRPAYDAFAFARRTLQDSTYIGEVGPADVLYPHRIGGYKFYRGDREIWVIWSLDGSPLAVTLLPGVPVAVYDAMGNQEVVINPLIVDITPRFLLWLP